MGSCMNKLVTTRENPELDHSGTSPWRRHIVFLIWTPGIRCFLRLYPPIFPSPLSDLLGKSEIARGQVPGGWFLPSSAQARIGLSVS